MEVVAEFDECPLCHKKGRLMQGIMAPDVLSGNAKVDAMIASEVRIIVNIDPTKPPLIGARIPAGRVFYDICTGCGYERPYRLEKGHASQNPAGGLPIFK